MNTVNLTVPVSWNQLTHRQVLWVCRLFLVELSEMEFRLRAFVKLAGLKAIQKTGEQGNFWFRSGDREIRIHQQELLHFLGSVDYLLDASRLSVNRMPVIWMGWQRLYGPSSKCYNLTLAEYIHACGALYGYMQTREFRYVDRLCAVLYRPSGKGSGRADRRRSFDEYTYLSRVRWFGYIPRAKRLAVLLFFQGCQWEFQKAFTHLFPVGSVSSELVNPVPHLQQLIRVLNQDDVTRNPVILNTPVWEAFAQLNDMMAKNKNTHKNG